MIAVFVGKCVLMDLCKVNSTVTLAKLVMSITRITITRKESKYPDGRNKDVSANEYGNQCNRQCHVIDRQKPRLEL